MCGEGSEVESGPEWENLANGRFVESLQWRRTRAVLVLWRVRSLVQDPMPGWRHSRGRVSGEISMKPIDTRQVFILGYCPKWKFALLEFIYPETELLNSRPSPVFLSYFHCPPGPVFSEWCCPSHQVQNVLGWGLASCWWLPKHLGGRTGTWL